MKQKKIETHTEELNEFLNFELLDIQKSPNGKSFKIKTNSSSGSDVMNITIKDTIDNNYNITISSNNISEELLKEILEMMI